MTTTTTFKRLGMIVPSLNTIAEDDFRAFCPPDVRYHVHRVRLRCEPGRVTMDDLARAYRNAVAEAALLKDMNPDAIAFNCTGASVACGERGDEELAERMTRELGVPSTNTMVAIKQALARRRVKKILHVCPFADEFAEIERRSLAASGIEIVRSVGLNFADARKAALMQPDEIAAVVRDKALAPGADGILLSCANVRAFEAAADVEREFGLPVVTSNQAVLQATLALAGYEGGDRC